MSRVHVDLIAIAFTICTLTPPNLSHTSWKQCLRGSSKLARMCFKLCELFVVMWVVMVIWYYAFVATNQLQIQHCVGKHLLIVKKKFNGTAGNGSHLFSTTFICMQFWSEHIFHLGNKCIEMLECPITLCITKSYTGSINCQMKFY